MAGLNIQTGPQAEALVGGLARQFILLAQTVSRFNSVVTPAYLAALTNPPSAADQAALVAAIGVMNTAVANVPFAQLAPVSGAF